jgi:hypothetical protein
LFSKKDENEQSVNDNNSTICMEPEDKDDSQISQATGNSEKTNAVSKIILNQDKV